MKVRNKHLFSYLWYMLNGLRNNQTVRPLESKLRYKHWRRVSKWQVNFNGKWQKKSNLEMDFFAILGFAIIEKMTFARISLQILYSFILPAILPGKTVLRYVFEAAWSKLWKSSLEKFSCYWKHWKKFFKSQMTLLWHVCKPH